MSSQIDRLAGELIALHEEAIYSSRREMLDGVQHNRRWLDSLHEPLLAAVEKQSRQAVRYALRAALAALVASGRLTDATDAQARSKIESGPRHDRTHGDFQD